MDFHYTPHLSERLVIRRIPRDLPRIVFEQARTRLIDTTSGLHVAVLRTNFKNRKREIALIYRQEQHTVTFITIHPLKTGQLQNRINAGRWALLPQRH